MCRKLGNIMTIEICNVAISRSIHIRFRNDSVPNPAVSRKINSDLNIMSGSIFFTDNHAALRALTKPKVNSWDDMKDWKHWLIGVDWHYSLGLITQESKKMRKLISVVRHGSSSLSEKRSEDLYYQKWKKFSIITDLLTGHYLSRRHLYKIRLHKRDVSCLENKIEY